MPQYLLSVYGDEKEFERQQADPELIQQIYADVDKVNIRMAEANARVFAGGLHPTNTATVVQAKDGEILMTDGPFIEAKEMIGGFWIIEANDLDAALAWAREATVACRLPVEVRPFAEDPTDNATG
jgi:hypothetical protein